MSAPVNVVRRPKGPSGRRGAMPWCRIAPVVALGAVALLGSTSPAMAQAVRAVRMEVENDYFQFWVPVAERTDHNYTHGTHVTFYLATTPAAIRGRRPDCGDEPLVPGGPGCVRSAVHLGQDLYTPVEWYPEPTIGQRPYAAVLYVDLRADHVEAHRMRAVALRLGTTGRAAGGEALQLWIHRTIGGFEGPFGWSYQLASQPIVMGTIEEHRLLLQSGAPRGRALDVVGHARLSAGTLASGAEIGWKGRAGWHLTPPFGGGAPPWGGVRPYVTAGAQAEWVGHSLVLDGNSQQTRGQVVREPLVGQWHHGVGVGVGTVELEFRVTTRSREYGSGPRTHSWSSLVVQYGAR